ncbi:MAG: M6 family metalloprotease domain-containing protein [Candidatus Glassbacteria bacterium]
MRVDRVFASLAVPALFLAIFLYAGPGAAAGPPKFRERLAPNPADQKYGDPAWAERMRRRRLLRERIAAGETALAASLGTDKFSLPVLLGNFSDYKNLKTREEFEQELFGDNPEGSMIDYYREISYGQFQLSGSVFGWFDSDRDKAYYVDGNNPAEFVSDIVAKADSSVDFSRFDNDGPDGRPNSSDDDGYVDGVYIVSAGPEDNEAFHPHMFSLADEGYETDDPAINGGFIRVRTYAITTELFSYDEENYDIHPIGTFCHEFGHVLGLPDLYDRTDAEQGPDFQASEGLGQWCLMASGSYGADGMHANKPVHMSAWCKIQLGWTGATLVTADGLISPEQAETAQSVYKIWENPFQSFRYFLVENREPVGFDRDLPSAGILIYHVDESRTYDLFTYSGPDNDDYRRKLVDLEEADGSDDLDNGLNRSDAGDPFPGLNGNRTFDDSSVPDSRDYEGNATGIAIRNISDPGVIMSADVSVRTLSGYTLAYDEKGMAQVLSWSVPDYWVGVNFRAEAAGALKEVILGVVDEAGPGYEVRVYNTFNQGEPSGLAATLTVTSEGQGWYSLPLEQAVELTEGQEFFIAVGGLQLLAVDNLGPSSNRTYFSSDGLQFSLLEGLEGIPIDIPLRALIQTAEEVVEPPAPLFAAAVGSRTFSNTTGTYEVWVDLDPLYAGATAYVIFGTDGGATFPDTLACSGSAERLTALLPALPKESKYSFYFEAVDEGGTLQRLPEDAPDNLYTLTVGASGDLNSDDKVDIFDLLSLLKIISGKATAGQDSDLNNDGKTDIFDLLALLKKLKN